MMKKILPIFLILLLPQVTQANYLNRFKCRQNISTIKNASLEFIQVESNMKWYKIGDSVAKFGEVESNIVSYMFLGGVFYGEDIGIIGNDNINKLLRYFRNKVETLYKDQNKFAVFTRQIERKDGSWVFIMPDEVIIIRRFSVHLGQVQVLCRDLWAEYAGVPELKTK